MNAQLTKKIRKTLAGFPDIQLAIIFGSIAKSTENVSSDVDIAILMNKAMNLHQKTCIIEELADVTGRPIDLIDLKSVGQPILGQIIKGVRILGSDASYAQLVLKNLHDQADFLPYRNRILKQRREAWIGK